jgi:hypothetical protein
MWKEVVTAYFKALSRHSRGRAEETQEICNTDNRCPCRDSNDAPAKYKSETFPPQPACPVRSFDSLSAEHVLAGNLQQTHIHYLFRQR